MIRGMFIPLARRLNSWVEKGLITPAQAEAIAQFEGHAGGRSWIVFGVVGTGVTAILTGIVSLIAANWESIPSAVKLFGYFAMQIGVGVAFLREEKKSTVWREAFLAIFVLLFWAGIGLFSQIYNLVGEGWPACFFWLAITLPAIAISRRPFLPHAWTVGLGATVIWWSNRAWISFDDNYLRTMVLCSLPILLAAVSFWAQVVTLLSEHFKRAFTIWGIGVYAVAGTIWGNIYWDVLYRQIHTMNLRYLLIPWSALALASAGSLARRRVPWTLRVLTCVFLVLIGAYVTIPISLKGDLAGHLTHQIIGATGFIVIAALGAYLAAMDHQKRLFELATQLIALRFIFIYFQIFGNLTKTGFGLILSGVVILGVTYFWTQIRKTLFKKMGGAS